MFVAGALVALVVVSLVAWWIVSLRGDVAKANATAADLERANTSLAVSNTELQQGKAALEAQLVEERAAWDVDRVRAETDAAQAKQRAQALEVELEKLSDPRLVGARVRDEFAAPDTGAADSRGVASGFAPGVPARTPAR